MNTIRFSHKYSKMPTAIHKNEKNVTILLAMDINDVSNLPAEFLDWDTEYKTEKGLAHYELPKGKVLILVLFTITESSDILWTTIRSWNPNKEAFYKQLIGKIVKIEVET